MEGEPKRIAKAVGIDFRSDRIGTVVKGVIARGISILSDAQDFSAQIVKVLCDKCVCIDTASRGVLSMPYKEFAVRAKSQGAICMVMKIIGDRHEDRFTIRQRDVGVLGISYKSGEASDFRGFVVDIAAIFSHVDDIHIPVHEEVWVQGKPQHSTIVELIDVCTDIKERRG